MHHVEAEMTKGAKGDEWKEEKTDGDDERVKKNKMVKRRWANLA